ncbi:MAG: hypothetical protein ACLGIA_03590 [Actinomycetes bacterium]
MVWVRGADQRTLTVTDAVAVFWLVFWLVIALVTAYQVWSLSQVSDTAQASARAADQAGQALQQLSQIPLVGDGPGKLGGQMREAAAQITQSAQDTRSDVRRLSVVLGLAIFLLPGSPVVWFYLPERLRRRRDVRELRRRLSDGGPDPDMEAYLARRAVANLTYAELTAFTPEPARDLREGRHEALARAELSRLGLRPGH